MLRGRCVCYSLARIHLFSKSAHIHKTLTLACGPGVALMHHCHIHSELLDAELQCHQAPWGAALHASFVFVRLVAAAWGLTALVQVI